MNSSNLQKTIKKIKDSWTKSCSKTSQRDAQSNQTTQTYNRFASQYRQIIVIHFKCYSTQSEQWTTIELSRESSDFIENNEDFNYDKYKDFDIKLCRRQLCETTQIEYHDFNQIHQTSFNRWQVCSQYHSHDSNEISTKKTCQRNLMSNNNVKKIRFDSKYVVIETTLNEYIVRK